MDYGSGRPTTSRAIIRPLTQTATAVKARSFNLPHLVISAQTEGLLMYKGDRMARMKSRMDISGLIGLPHRLRGANEESRCGFGNCVGRRAVGAVGP